MSTALLLREQREELKAAAVRSDLTVIHVIQASAAVQYGISVEQRLSAHEMTVYQRDSLLSFRNMSPAFRINDTHTFIAVIGEELSACNTADRHDSLPLTYLSRLELWEMEFLVNKTLD